MRDRVVPRPHALGLLGRRGGFFPPLVLLAVIFACAAARAQQVLPPNGVPVGLACAYNTSPPTVTSGQIVWVQCDNLGQLITSGGGGGGGNVNLTGINGTTPLTNSGATGAGSLRVTAAQDTSTIAGSAPGTVGTPSTQVLTIQGITGGAVAVGVNGNLNNGYSGVTTAFNNVPAMAFGYAFNGTTWDQLQADGSKYLKVNCVTGCSGGGGGGAVTLASGAVASGAYSAGSLATGAGVDGWNLTEGTKADSAYAGSGSASEVAIEKGIYAAVVAPIATQAPTVSIGGVGIVDSAGTNVATVKAASTLPAASDKTLVVGLNPGTATAGSPTGAIVTVQGVSGGQALPVSSTGAVNQTLTDCSGNITSGGTAQNAFTAQTTLHGFTIMNIDTTEPLWISFTGTAAAAASGSYPLQAATATTFATPGSFTSGGGMGTNHALSVIATTTSHKWSCTWW